MFAAARYNQTQALDLLLQKGDGDIYAINGEGQTLAHVALQAGDNSDVLVSLARCSTTVHAIS